jgi:hypothetical protein
VEILHDQQLRDAGRALSPDPEIARQLQPYERARLAQEAEYVLRFSPPRELRKAEPEPAFRRTLPLPGGPRPGVDPVTVPSVGN